jgi:transcriptional regulator with XRE-family HTH domain
MIHATAHVASAFKAARERKAISQRELSARAGVPQAQISRFESGAVDIRLSSLVSLARALDLEIELVPRKAVSAVESIVRSATSGERNSDAIRAAAIEVSKLTKAIKAVHVPDLPSLQTDKVLANLRVLERFQPTAAQLEAIRKFNDVLEKAKSLSIDPDVFVRHAEMIEQARNQLAYAPPPASLPKPAYALDDDDEDDA